MRSHVFFALFFLAACGGDAGSDTDEGTGATDPDDTNAPDTGDPTGTGTGTTPTEMPTEPVDAASLGGNTYAVDLASGTFVEPAGVGPLIQSQLDVELLLGVVTANDTEVQLRGSMMDASGGQDMCMPTIEFPNADFTGNPLFEVGPESLDLVIQGAEVTIDDLMLSGGFAVNGDEIVGIEMAGAIDTRPLVGLIGETDPNAICDLVAGFGAACVACSDGSGDYCLEVLVRNLKGVLESGLTLVEVTDAVVAADPSCQ